MLTASIAELIIIVIIVMLILQNEHTRIT